MLKAIGSKIDLNDKDLITYYYLVADLLESDVVQQMKNFTHHGETTCFQHCLNVSYYNYRLCRFFSLNERAGARAGLLHDLFLYDWHTYKPAKGKWLHGFTHARLALETAKENFYISDLESDIIEKHMFPLNITALPKYRETLVIVLVDKYCGLLETVIPRLRKISKLFSKRKKVVSE
ncbi:MAG: HD domain-containing protein [Ruminococcus sp.]|nr:HD domain-containing protein [Ruminococcus sp.]MCM1382190.1 HD domain-containing protein [Muribaculaceae bacterium]MCM1479886.1 HD domain-containing protein [Muribaculaceae bacterium]